MLRLCLVPPLPASRGPRTFRVQQVYASRWRLARSKPLVIGPSKQPWNERDLSARKSLGLGRAAATGCGR